MPKWIKGQSGNPGGRKRGRVSMAEELRYLLNTRDESGNIWGERILRTLASAAAMGNVEAIKVVFDRVDGRVPDQQQPASTGVTNVYIDGMKLGERPPREPPEAT